MRYYYLGCAALGLTTGLLVGLSQSPVVQYVLPLLFALLGGAASIFAFKSPTAKSSSDSMSIAGLSATSLALPFLFAVLYGSVVRTGADIMSLIPSWSRKAEPDLFTAQSMPLLSTDDAVSILLIDRNLKAIGTKDSDRLSVVRFVIDNRTKEFEQFKNTEKQVIDSSAELLKRLEEVGTSADPVTEDSAFQSLWNDVEILSSAINQPGALWSEKLEACEKAYEGLSGAKGGALASFLRKDPAIAKPLGALITALSALPPRSVITEATKTTLTESLKAPSVEANLLFGTPKPSVAVND